MGGIKLLQNETIPRLQKFPVVLRVPLFRWTQHAEFAKKSLAEWWSKRAKQENNNRHKPQK